MWKDLLDMYEKLKLLNKPTARPKLYTMVTEDVESIQIFSHHVQTLGMTLRNMGAVIDEK